MRHGLLPALRALHPAAEANVLRTLALLRDEAAVLDEVALAAAREPPEVTRLAALPLALARLAVQALADRAAGGRAPAVGARCEEILALGPARRQRRARRRRRPARRRRVRRAALRHRPAAARAGRRPCCRCPAAPRTAPARWPASRPRTARSTPTPSAPRLEARPWRAGDRVRLPAGTRSLQDLFTDLKVPRERRPQLPVVLAAGEVAWVPGVATAERFAATPDHAPPRLSSPGARLPASTMLQDDKIGEILVQADELQHRIKEMAAEVSRDYAGKDLLLIGVLKGAVFFLADLMRQLDMHCEVDFMAVASYGSSTESSGVVRILKDLDAPLEGRHVLIVEDIVDSGLTLQYLMRTLEARGPASLEVCALLTKPERRRVETPARYVGFEIPDKFAIGYGLDFAERYRNLPYVAALTGIAD